MEEQRRIQEEQQKQQLLLQQQQYQKSSVLPTSLSIESLSGKSNSNSSQIKTTTINSVVSPMTAAQTQAHQLIQQLQSPFSTPTFNKSPSAKISQQSSVSVQVVPTVTSNAINNQVKQNK